MSHHKVEFIRHDNGITQQENVKTKNNKGEHSFPLFVPVVDSAYPNQIATTNSTNQDPNQRIKTLLQVVIFLTGLSLH